ncbi:MAG: creatininase family protein [Candidatus Chisholmbacteria bacterium]|nr:creatininase family protein [Candidatus Chisholmbacteria bacterium]
MNKSIWLHDLTWQDVERHVKKDAIVIVPVGSTEEHGLAAPLGLDTYVAIALAEDVAKKMKVLVSPPLWFGDSSHHLGFPGTISLRTATLTSVIEDISHSLAKAGFRKILFINGHKIANLPAIVTAVKNVHEASLKHVLFAIIDPSKIAKGVAKKMKREPEHHAGDLETSHLIYKYPHLINKSQLPKKNINFVKIFSPFSHFDLLGPANEVIDIAWNSEEQRRFAPTGAFSASHRASAEKGKQYHDYMVEIISQFIRWLRRYQGPIGAAE